jgi:hydroxypyruvate isomerase
MPVFAANLTMLFTEVPFLERFALAREAGFKFVEYLLPYEYTPGEIRKRLGQNGLRQVLFNLPCGDWAGGDRGIAANPNRVNEFRTGVAKAVDYALGLGVPTLNCLAGKRVPGVDEATHRATFVANLKHAARMLAAKDLRLVMEPINHYDIPGFWLNRTDQALALLEEVGEPNLSIQYDIYHAQREEGELTATLRNHLARIGHIQVADNPGRHQPGTGEINYAFLFRELDRLGYQGYVGLEYVPTPDSRSSFGWIRAMGY